MILAIPKSSTFHNRPRLVARDEDVVRLEIAVDDARPMRGREGATDAGHDHGQRRRAQHALPSDALGERLALEVLHRDIRHAFVDAVVEDLHDVDAAEPCRGLSLDEEAGEEAGLPRHREGGRA